MKLLAHHDARNNEVSATSLGRHLQDAMPWLVRLTIVCDGLWVHMSELEEEQEEEEEYRAADMFETVLVENEPGSCSPWLAALGLSSRSN